MPCFIGKPTTPRPEICEFCGAERHTEGINLGVKVLWYPSGAKACSCPKGKAEHERNQSEAKAIRMAEEKAEADNEMRRRVERIIGNSGMGERFLQRTFATYKTDDPATKKIYAVCLKYAQNFSSYLPIPMHGQAVSCRNGFVITGAKGTGKTHIAAAIANMLMAQGTAVIFMTECNLFGKIRDAYAKGCRFGGDGQTESEIRRIYETVPLLVIDDLGKEKPTEWTLSTLYAIIEGRYDKAMPTIITTNYDAQNLILRLTPTDGERELNKVTAEAIVDRLIEMCESITVTGDSWRLR